MIGPESYTIGMAMGTHRGAGGGKVMWTGRTL